MKSAPSTNGTATCRTCKWFGKSPDKSGKIVPRKGDHCRCTVPIPPPPVMPASVRIMLDGRAAYGHDTIRWPSSGGWMGVDDGAGCTFHEVRIK